MPEQNPVTDEEMVDFACKRLSCGTRANDIRLILTLATLTDKSFEEIELAVNRAEGNLSEGFRRIV